MDYDLENAELQGQEILFPSKEVEVEEEKAATEYIKDPEDLYLQKNEQTEQYRVDGKPHPKKEPEQDMFSLLVYISIVHAPS